MLGKPQGMPVRVELPFFKDLFLFTCVGGVQEGTTKESVQKTT